MEDIEVVEDLLNTLLTAAQEYHMTSCALMPIELMKSESFILAHADMRVAIRGALKYFAAPS